MKPNREIAYHEAGHAVVTYRLGFYLGNTTIEPDSSRNLDGYSQPEAVWADGSRDADDIVIAFAGYAAQRRYNPSADVRGSAGDNEGAAELLKQHPDLSEAELRGRSEELVVEHWKEIEAVATALVEAITLPGDEVEIICDAVDEGDWRLLLEKYRQRRGLVGRG